MVSQITNDCQLEKVRALYGCTLQKVRALYGCEIQKVRALYGCELQKKFGYLPKGGCSLQSKN